LSSAYISSISSGQTLASGAADTTINFDADIAGPVGITNTAGVFTIDVGMGGTYLIVGEIVASLTGSDTSTLAAQITTPSAGGISVRTSISASNPLATVPVSGIYILAEGDTVELQALTDNEDIDVQTAILSITKIAP
jgi:hypothetical protein